MPHQTKRKVRRHAPQHATSKQPLCSCILPHGQSAQLGTADDYSKTQLCVQYAGQACSYDCNNQWLPRLIYPAPTQKRHCPSHLGHQDHRRHISPPSIPHQQGSSIGPSRPKEKWSSEQFNAVDWEHVDHAMTGKADMCKMW